MVKFQTMSNANATPRPSKTESTEIPAETPPTNFPLESKRARFLENLLRSRGMASSSTPTPTPAKVNANAKEPAAVKEFEYYCKVDWCIVIKNKNEVTMEHRKVEKGTITSTSRSVTMGYSQYGASISWCHPIDLPLFTGMDYDDFPDGVAKFIKKIIEDKRMRFRKLKKRVREANRPVKRRRLD